MLVAGDQGAYAFLCLARAYPLEVIKKAFRQEGKKQCFVGLALCLSGVTQGAYAFLSYCTAVWADFHFTLLFYIGGIFPIFVFRISWYAFGRGANFQS